jgi:hypothetical protein
MLHHIATISVCYGGHFESKMTAKIQKSSDLGEIWYYYRHDRVKNCEYTRPDFTRIYAI